MPQRRLDSLWGRSSYTSWTKASHPTQEDSGSRDDGRDIADPTGDWPAADGEANPWAASREGEAAMASAAPGADVAGPQASAAARAARGPAGPRPGDRAEPGWPQQLDWPRNGPLADFPRGSGAGDCLHRILEHVDYQQPMEAPENRLVSERELRRAGFGDQPLLPLLQGLEQMRRTPFGGDLGGWCLARLPRGQRLNEMAFDLSLELV
ncbi:MAG: hypothetical protein VKN83_04385, partial [Cyanobacteriota bacterium]|nr:hypothetical protein [Cyanobacteriota bacterium]